MDEIQVSPGRCMKSMSIGWMDEASSPPRLSVGGLQYGNMVRIEGQKGACVLSPSVAETFKIFDEMLSYFLRG